MILNRREKEEGNGLVLLLLNRYQIGLLIDSNIAMESLRKVVGMYIEAKIFY